MTTEEYVPSDDDVRIEYVLAHQGLEAQLDAGEAYDRWLAAHDARVRRDAEAELDSWMTRAYEAEKRAWKAEKRLAAWMEHWNATARTGAVDEVAAILEANARADHAEARIKAVRDLCDAREDPDQWPPRQRLHGGAVMPASLMGRDIRHALEG